MSSLSSDVKAGRGFRYLTVAQRSPEWYEIRRGRITASRLADWMAKAKRANKEGDFPPLKARLDYERELRFEKQFNVDFSKFTTGAMQDGIDYEDAVAHQYELITGREVAENGIFYSKKFAATPDRLVGNTGLLEIKVLFDTSFTEVLENDTIEDHYLQIQGQLMATGRKWCDYVVANLNTKKVKIFRVRRDVEKINEIRKALDEPFHTKKFNTKNLYDFVEENQETTAEPSANNDEMDF